ncbi:hypothetical protein MOW14_14670 (plasmid) [Acinetobacter indicus]|uniref:hypothetical protein n=1 Tax=Acinetobacter indicus TaxID=756892 RepID=UPI001FA7EF15|nr:hypothetical protein [Acinetobacter indicus]UNW11144.1 hypothetical protein MOW14_14670 [Acinetobacter indicus]
MDYNILAMRNFNICLTSQLKNGNRWGIENISKVRPHEFLNGGIDLLNSSMFDCSDYQITRICSGDQFRTYLRALERFYRDNPISDALKATNTLTGYSIADCLAWAENNLEIIFQDYLIKPCFESERDLEMFKLIHLQLMQLFRFCGENGFIQFATTATNDKAA